MSTNPGMEKTEFGGWKNCIRLFNGQMEMVITTDVGPRVARLGLKNGHNFMKEYKEQQGVTGGDEWRIYGGHRLWHGPESNPRTYAPDNVPVKYEWDGKTLKLTNETEKSTGIAKEIEITLDPNKNKAVLVHRLINNNLWDIEAAVWCLSVMAPGGRAIVPQEEYRSHPEYLLPARPIVLWHYTNMADPRWIWGERYIQLEQVPGAKTKQKVGLFNKQGWAAYYLNKQLFVKKYGHCALPYTDMGCNTELFTDGNMLELETLGPLMIIEAGGGSVEHVEEWYLYEAQVSTDEKDIDANVLELVK